MKKPVPCGRPWLGRLGCFLALALLIGACTAPGSGSAPERAGGGSAPSIESLVPSHVLSSSVRLAHVYANGILTITPLASPPGGSAIRIVEHMSTDREVWGREMQKASRLVAAAFADDRGYGRYLAIVFDPEIEGEDSDTVVFVGRLADRSDQFPPLLFVWTRGEVERYAACGIPPPGAYSDCTNEFTEAATVREVAASFVTLLPSDVPVV